MLGSSRQPHPRALPQGGDTQGRWAGPQPTWAGRAGEAGTRTGACKGGGGPVDRAPQLHVCAAVLPPGRGGRAAQGLPSTSLSWGAPAGPSG